MVLADIGLGELLWSLLVLLFMIVYLMMLFSVVVDLFRDHEMRGISKAVWALFLLFVPVVSVFVYLFARGDGMAARGEKQARAMDEQLHTSPADQIARAKALLDDGAISAEEFDALKRKALAG